MSHWDFRVIRDSRGGRETVYRMCAVYYHTPSGMMKASTMATPVEVASPDWEDLEDWKKAIAGRLELMEKALFLPLLEWTNDGRLIEVTEE